MTWRLAFLSTRAIYEMVRYQVLYRAIGYEGMKSALRREETARRQVDPEAIELVCKAVNLAAAFYYKRVRCLQKSAVTFRLLRGCGVEAHLLAGSRQAPFMSHAWVEVDGRVTNESAAFKQMLKVIWSI